MSLVLHGLVHVNPIDMAGRKRRGVNDGDTRAIAQSARQIKQKQVKSDLCLTLSETVVGDNGELILYRNHVEVSLKFGGSGNSVYLCGKLHREVR